MGKKGFYILTANLVIAGVLVANFSFKSANDGQGLLYPVAAWWKEVNAVKHTEQVVTNTVTQDTTHNAQITVSEPAPIEVAPNFKLETSPTPKSVEEPKAIKEVKEIKEDKPTKVVKEDPTPVIEEKKASTPAVASLVSIEQEHFKHENSFVLAHNVAQKLQEDKEVAKENIKVSKDSSDSKDTKEQKDTKEVKVESKSDKPLLVANHTPMCISYGPLNLEQKVAFDIILSKYDVSDDMVKKSKEELYEINWNLGKNKVAAVEMFEKQKNDGPLQDEKFKIRQEKNGDYIVPISTIAGNQAMAKKLADDLKKSAKNMGGLWESNSRSEGYFYQVKDIKSLPDNAVGMINQSINALKTPC